MNDQKPFYVLQAEAMSGERYTSQSEGGNEVLDGRQGAAVARGENANVSMGRFDYAWKWFEYHAAQRARMLHFFLIVTGILAAAYGAFLKTDESETEDLQRVLMVAGFFTAIAFVCLDCRNQRRVHLGEDVLRQVERDYLFQKCRPDQKVSLGILQRELCEEREWKQSGCCRGRWWLWLGHTLIKHRLWIPLLEGAVGLLFLWGILSSLSGIYVRILLQGIVTTVFIVWIIWLNVFARGESTET